MPERPDLCQRCACRGQLAMKWPLAVLGGALLISLAAVAVIMLRPKPIPPLAAAHLPAATTTTVQAPPAVATPAPTQSPAATTPGAVVTVPSVTTPWAVVSAYYADIESGNYQQAWALINSGATTGQTYQQFVDGYACTGAESVTEIGRAGDQVTFDLSATDTCTSQQQQFTGTDTVRHGKIIAATISQVS